MIKVEIWTKSTYRHERDEFKGRELPCVLIFRGEVQQVPRVGEHVDPFGWASGEPVIEVWWKLEHGSAELYVGPDHTGEYVVEAKKRGIPQRFYP